MKKPFLGNLFALILILNLIFSDVYFNILNTLFGITGIAASIIVHIFIYILPMSIYFFITKSNIVDTLYIKPIKPLNVLVITLISLLIQPLMMLVSAISTLLFPNNVTTTLSNLTDQPLWFLLFLTAVMPAVFEETFFRGLVFSNYRGVTLKKGFIMSGIIFAITHLDGQQFLYAFFMGMIFSYFVYITGSIFASITSHFVINASQISLMYMVYNTTTPTETPSIITLSTLMPYIRLTLFTIIPLFLMFIMLYSYNKKEETFIKTEEFLDFKNTTPNESIINAPFIIILIVFIYTLIVPNI